MKLIHCSDVHLDSRMESNLSAAQAKERGAEICQTFARMVRFAREQEVAAVLIAGDLFDTERCSARTADFVLDCIRGAEQIDFLYLRGNHDGCRDLFAGREMPDNFITFGSSWKSCRYGDAVITAMEPEGDGWLRMYGELRLNPDDTNIVMLHGQESARAGEELISIPALRGKNIHYLALGHIHSHKLEKLDHEGVYCYSGCLEGRGFDECGEKGFVLLDVQPGRVRAEFVPFARRTLHEVPVDLTGLTTAPQIQAAMERLSEDIGPDALVKFTLTGSFTPETQKDPLWLQKMLEPRFWFVKVKDESRLKIEKESYEQDISLKGEFIRMVMASSRTDEEKEAIICCGLQALSGGEVTL